MRFFSFLLLIGLLCTTSAAAFSLNDNLNEFWKVQASKYTASRVVAALPGWPGYETAALATDAQFSKSPFVLVVRKVGGSVLLPFGIVETPTSLLLDSDGDGTADWKTSKNLVPGWVFLKVPGPRGDAKAFRALTDRIYQQYNSQRGPVPAQLNLLLDELKKHVTDSADADRDLSGALQFFFDNVIEQKVPAVGTLAALTLELKKRGGVPPVVYLFLGEALEAGGAAEAQSAYDLMLKVDPKSVIAAFKKARIDPTAYQAFKKAHPDFWASRE